MNNVKRFAANPGEVTTSLGFAGVENMQNLTSTLCKNVATGTEGLLKDTRDGKTYWVAKLKDNNCWMTQNLDYDDASSTKVTAPSGWTSTSNTYRAYYDAGDYIQTDLASWTACNSTGTGLSSCTGNGWTLASNLQPDATWSSTTDDNFVQATSYESSDGKMMCTKTAGSFLGDMTSSYLPCRVYYYKYVNKQFMQHYHIGNYYSYVAATNGTGTSATTDGSNASSSICPTNWKLPTSKVTTTGSFGSLTTSLTQTTLRQAPYYFVTGGGVWSGTLNLAGSQGRYWSSTARDGSYAYYLNFSSSSVNPSDTIYRYFGLSVRCLVQGS